MRDIEHSDAVSRRVQSAIARLTFNINWTKVRQKFYVDINPSHLHAFAVYRVKINIDALKRERGAKERKVK